MNKKLIAVAIAAAVAAPAAVAADTTLYGKAHVSVQSNDNGAGDNYTVNSNASRLGVKGSEDLGDGLKAIFKYEMGYNISDGGAAGTPISARNAYVGLSGGFGTVLAGRHDTPAKVAFYAAGNDHLGDSIIDFNKIGFTEVRADNAVAYISPNFSGFTVAAAIVPGEQSGVASTTTTWTPVGAATNTSSVNTNANSANNLADAYSLGMMYAGGGLKVGVGYEVFTSDLNGGGTAKDQKMWQIGASYTFGDFTVGGEYEDKSDVGGTANYDITVWGLAAKANFGNNFLVVNYGNKDQSGTRTDTDTFGIGVGHKFSKRTQVYAAYANHDNSGTTADTSAFALGMIHTF